MQVRILKIVVWLVALAAVLLILDWQQHWRAQNLIEEQGDPTVCRIEAPCKLRSVQADLCNILSDNRSFLGRTFRPEIKFQPQTRCRRGGRSDVHYWLRESE